MYTWIYVLRPSNHLGRGTEYFLQAPVFVQIMELLIRKVSSTSQNFNLEFVFSTDSRLERNDI